MNSLIISMIVGFAFVAGCSATADFYNSQAWKESVNFDAPIIEPERTLEALKKLVELIPISDDKYGLGIEFNAFDDDWTMNEMNGIMHNNVQRLIDLSDMSLAEPCSRMNLARFAEFDDRNGTTQLTSLGGQKAYGPNIKAYIKHYKDEIQKLC